MAKISEDESWLYLEDDDPANLPSFRHICIRCGIAITGTMERMGMLKIHDDWHTKLEES